jgi:DNA-binding PadR family transcriptional regulator
MSSTELTFFSYEILGLVGRGGAGAHDLLRMARHGRILDWAGESQYYVEPKRLAKLGYLQARKEPGKTRERTVYTLTEKGLQALDEFAQTPVRFVPVKSDLLLRLLIADLVGEQATRESVAALREDLADLYARLDETEAKYRESAPPAQVPTPRHRLPPAAARAPRANGRRGRARAHPRTLAAPDPVRHRRTASSHLVTVVLPECCLLRHQTNYTRTTQALPGGSRS